MELFAAASVAVATCVSWNLVSSKFSHTVAKSRDRFVSLWSRARFVRVPSKSETNLNVSVFAD